jgi:hypothetical protein
MSIKENRMHKEIENLSELVKVTQVSDAAHRPFVGQGSN